MRGKEAGRGRKGPSDLITSWYDRDLGEGQGRQMWGNRTSHSSHSLVRGTPCGHPAREIRSDERWRLAGGGVVQVDGCFAPR